MNEIIGDLECPDCEGTGDGHDGWWCRGCNGEGRCDVYAPDEWDEA